MKAVDPLVTGRLVRVDAAAQNLVSGGDGDAQVRREAVGSVTADGEPARGVEQEGVVGVYGGELDAVDGGFFAAAQASFVGELQRGGLAFGQRLVEAEPHGEIHLRRTPERQ